MTFERWNSLDIIKAIMVPAMIIVHNTIWWLSYHPSFIAGAMETWFLFIRYISYLVLLIPATAGAALFFYLKQHRENSLPSFKKIVLRALILSAVGFAMNIAAFGSAAFWQWNVLQFFSISMIIIYGLLVFAPSWSISVIGAFTLFSAPLWREIFAAFTDNYVFALLIGEPTNIHLWPLLPWFSVVAMGFATAQLFHSSHFNKRSVTFVITVGSLLTLVSAISGKLLLEIDFNNLWGESIFQPPTLQMIGTLGIGFLLFGSTHYLFKNVVTTPYSLVQCFSCGLFYVYVIHMIFGHRLQQLVLQYNEAIVFLWLSVIAQVIIAYGIGALVVYLKSIAHKNA